MSILRVSPRPSRSDIFGSRDALAIGVDGDDLFDLIAEVERLHTPYPFRYSGPPSRVALAPSRYLLCEPSGDPDWDAASSFSVNEITIGIGTGNPSPQEWPLCVQVNVEPERVTWSGFYNWLVRDREEDWGWAAVGPFEFDREQYDRAIGFV